MAMLENGGRLSRAAEAGLAALIEAGEGALTLEDVAVSACLYPRALVVGDPGSFEQQAVWEHRASEQIYPASVCKMFYLAALGAFSEQGLLTLDEEDHRAVKAMIGVSSNDATTYLLSRLTGAFDGAPLPEDELENWLNDRAKVQRWLDGLNIPAFEGIHLLHSTYEDSPYGRAKQARLARGGNTLSARACAAMIHEMLRGALPNHAWMAEQMSRDWQRSDADPDGDQVGAFLTGGIPAGFRVWSKAGHTSWTRHDVVSLEAPNGEGATLAVMTLGTAAANNTKSLPAFARAFIGSAFA